MNRAVAGLTVTALVLVGCSSGGSTGDPEAFCRGFARLGDQVAAAAEPPEELADVPSASRLADEIATTADALRATAPDDIAEDAQRLATVTAELARDLRDFYQAIVDDPARANDPTFLNSFEPVSEDRSKVITEAGAKVRPWVAEHCGGAPSPTSPTSTSGDSTSTSKRVPAPRAV